MTIETKPTSVIETRKCGHCHTCGTRLRKVLDGEEFCDKCGTYCRYRSHGWFSKGNRFCPSVAAVAESLAAPKPASLADAVFFGSDWAKQQAAQGMAEHKAREEAAELNSLFASAPSRDNVDRSELCDEEFYREQLASDNFDAAFEKHYLDASVSWEGTMMEEDR